MFRIHDLSKEELVQETRVYRFLHQLNICADTAKRLWKKGGDLRFEIKAKENSLLATEFSNPDLQTITELAVVIEPLVRQSSDINFAAILEMCRKNKESPKLSTFITEATNTSNKIGQGSMRLNLNGQDLTPSWIYERFMDKIVNVGDVDAREYEQNLSHDPMMRDLLYLQFYDYCMNMVSFLLWVQGVIKKEGFLPEGANRNYLCIICKRSGENATFSKVEHTLPEALGNTHSILPRGYYCDECQDMMAPIEARVVNTIPFAMTRLLCTKHTKSGKFPSAKLGHVHCRKTKLNHLQIDVFGGKKVIPQGNDVEDGRILFNLAGTSKFDHIALGRVLVKATLGAMTLELGREYVLNERFDSAREFIRTGEGLHARLLMRKKATPEPQMTIEWRDFENGTVGVVMRSHGVQFMFAVTPIPNETPPPKEIMREMEVFDLWNTGPTPHYRLGEAAD